MDGFSSAKNNYMGEIQLIIGPMFSGKTTELMRRINRYRIAEKRCYLIKYSNDVRYDVGCNIVSHDQVKMDCTSVTMLSQVSDDWNNFDVIGIDEGQFFPDVVEFCETMANKGKTIIISALDGTFQRKPFGQILELVPLSEYVTKLKAICHTCKSEASFTNRIGMSEQIELIGGTDLYEAACRTCMNRKSSLR